MHRDVKLGLSLGILLVGITGALFLRRDPAKKADALPQLQDTAKLDERIKEKPNMPHLMGPEEFSEPPAAPAKKDGARPKENAKAKGPGYQVPEFLTKEDAAAQQEILHGRSPGTP